MIIYYVVTIGGGGGGDRYEVFLTICKIEQKWKRYPIFSSIYGLEFEDIFHL